jgi:chromosome segregation ATPase
MRLKNWLGTSILLAAFGLLGLPALAQQSQSGSSQQSSDPVADAARKAREQQKTAPKPKHVFTDDDVRHSTDTGSATPAGGQNAGDAKAGDQKGQGAQGSGAAGDKKDDPATTWRKRFADQRNKIASAEKELDVLQRELDKSQLQYYSDPQKAMQEQNSRQDINDKTAKIDAKKQEIANLKQQLSDMEDELRKSGGDPGWVR